MFDGLSSRALRLGVVAAAATALVASFGGPADAAPKKAKAGDDHRSVGANYNHGKALRFSAKESDSGGGAQEGGAVVGTVRQWPALDDENGVVYTKRYRLRGVGDHIEIWVAEDRAYPAGDCRNTIDGGAPITGPTPRSRRSSRVRLEHVPEGVRGLLGGAGPNGSNTKLKKSTPSSSACPPELLSATATETSSR